MKTPTQYIILLHGMLFGSWHMLALQRSCETAGYKVINIGYPSSQYPIEGLIKCVSKNIESSDLDKDAVVHFVGYSLGGLIVRGLLTHHKPAHLGRVVQIGPPNHGSEVADFLKHYLNPLYSRVCGQAGQELGTHNMPLEAFLGPVTTELGVIAGNSSISPVSALILPGENDGKVTVESTRIEGMKDHMILPISHIFLPLRKAVHHQVLSFIQSGYFDRNSKPL